MATKAEILALPAAPEPRLGKASDTGEFLVIEPNAPGSEAVVLSPTPLSNYSATAAPAVTDDSSEGYSIGSKWFDTVAKEAYVLADATEGAAVWLNATLTPDELGSAAFLDTGDTIGDVPVWSEVFGGSIGLDYQTNYALFAEVYTQGIYGISGNLCLDTAYHTLNDFASGVAVDALTRQLVDGSSLPSVDWANRTLTDSASNYAVDWGNRYMYDDGYNVSIDWQWRQLVNPSLAIVMDWYGETAYFSVGITYQPLNVASLPVSFSEGTECYVNDLDSPVIGSVPAGGGSGKGKVICNGTDWIITAIV